MKKVKNGKEGFREKRKSKEVFLWHNGTTKHKRMHVRTRVEFFKKRKAQNENERKDNKEKFL